MELQIKAPTQVINRLYRREKINPEAFDLFFNALDNYFYYTKRAKEVGETEENVKQYLGDFLKVFYPNFDQNTKSYKGNHEADWTISTAENQKVQLLFEIKKAENTAEMITAEKPNRKALHELITYYLWERIVYDNHEVKHLVITNMEDFFIFDATDFHRFFYKNSSIVKQFTAWKANELDATSTEEMYSFLKKFIKDAAIELPVIHFNLLTIQPELAHFKQSENKHKQAKAERTLAEIYKIFAPKFLLKKAIANDSNELNKEFYFELLHILGLEEKTENGKKIIVRCAKPNNGSLLENTITKLRTEDLLYNLRQQKAYGKTTEERYFSIALELVITWLNRILFLKLLEAQLTVYNAEDDDKNAFRFLHPTKVREFDTLNTLFFEVLALPEKEREAHIIKQYNRIPYLNSSLFEVTDLERKTLRISNIKDNTLLPIYEKTVLKTADGKKSLYADNQSTKLPTLKYLLDFLEAYDFGAEASETILKSDTKPLINAAVLGLIFEKINGYKEGSFFTPGFITMYMSQETLRRIVVDKFNDKKTGFGLEADSFEDVRNFCHKLYKSADLAKANAIINSITICDPAVGSGHFLVSVLNELLAIKSELGILCDLNGKTLFGKITLKVENDELVIYDKMNLPFAYKVSFATGLRKLVPELQQIQETIFHEKKYLIEHCLFGVDINPNSVKICRLRLWVELLKNAYYRQGRNTQLETLPNIDINIKTGNSLISRFALDADLNEVFKKTGYSVEEYKRSVKAYKTEANKGQKRQLSEYLEEIKAEFQVTFDKREIKKIADARGKKEKLELQIANNKNFGYEPTKTELAELKKLTNSLLKREAEKAETLSSDIYQNAFEWRFEFPEVLDENGAFVGFDVVIGNPPYIRQEEIKHLKTELKKRFEVYQSTADIYVYFLELGLSLIKEKGIFNAIIANKWMRANYGKPIRQFLKTKRIFEIVDFGDLPVFPGVSAYPCIIGMNNENPNTTFKAIEMPTLDFENLYTFVNKNAFKVATDSLSEEGYNLINQTASNLLNKIIKQGITLDEYVEGKINRGVVTGYNKAFIIDEETRAKLINEDEKSIDIIKPFLTGKEISPYGIPKIKNYLIFAKRGIEIDNYQGIKNHLLQFKSLLIPKPKDYNSDKKWQGRKSGSYKWYEIQDNIAYHREFEKVKIIYQVFQVKPAFLLDELGSFCNNATWIIPRDDKYLLALLNSKLGWYLIGNYCTKINNGFQLIYKYLKQIPIKKINFEDKLEKNLHDQIVEKVEQILALKKADANAATSILENHIDKLVYQLYGLTESEIEIIEN